MENPLRIPMTCLSSEYGKLERQVQHYLYANMVILGYSYN